MLQYLGQKVFFVLSTFHKNHKFKKYGAKKKTKTPVLEKVKYEIALPENCFKFSREVNMMIETVPRMRRHQFQGLTEFDI